MLMTCCSDADLERYDKSPAEWNRILGAEPSVRACAVLIASNEVCLQPVPLIVKLS